MRTERPARSSPATPSRRLEKVGNTRKRGTQVCFKPDPRVFEDTHFNGDTVRRRVRELAYLNQGVRFVFTDEREKDETRRRREYCYEGGLADFVQYLNTDKQTITGPITFEGRREGTLLRVAIQYTDSYTENIYSFVNNVPTGEGGTHETGFKAAVTKAFNDYARRVGLLKEKDNNLSGEDFREGMTAVVYAGVQKPQFEGQTKGRLGNTEVRPIVEAICLEQLSLYLDDLKNQEVATRIVEKAVKAAKVREAARKARDVARQKNQTRGRAAGGQALQLHRPQLEGERTVHRRGRFRRRQRQAGPRPALSGHSAPARQAPQRREKAHRPGAGQRGVPLHHHRAGHGHRRGV